jgi:hypothetical protein
MERLTDAARDVNGANGGETIEAKNAGFLGQRDDRPFERSDPDIDRV